MSSNSSRIITNTSILYGKMILSIGLILLTTRLVLSALGVIDYGIFELIAGIITMLSFLNLAMTVSTQRFLSYYLGKKDLEKQTKVFSNSLLLHILIGLVLVFIFKIIGLHLFDGMLNIPVSRVSSAKHIYDFMSLTVFFTIISVPFIAVLNARENMLFVSIIYLLEVILKLGIAASLFLFLDDRLILFGFSMPLVSCISFLLYVVFCFKRYSECTFMFFINWDIKMMQNLASFAGWNLIGALCSVGRIQGIAILLNIFFGTIVNAAYGIANQISSQMTFLSLSMLRAINPQIMSSEGEGDRQRMLSLSIAACKFGFLLFSAISIPCIFEMNSILSFWLNKVPEYTVIFCILLLISIMISQISIGLQSAIQAIGKIKLYQLVVGSILLLNIPISFCLLYFKFPIYSVFYSMIVLEVVALIFRLFLLKSIARLSLNSYFQNVIYKSFIPLISSILVCFISVITLNFPYRFILTGFLSISVFIISVYFFSLNENEIFFVKKIVRRVIRKC